MTPATCALLVGLLAPQAPQGKPEATRFQGGPRIAIEPARFDFGRVLQGKTVHKEFFIRNFGGQDLVIEDVSTTCDCALALGATRRIPPGGFVPLRVSLRTRTATGRLLRSVLVKSNDPTRSIVEVRVEATIIPARSSKQLPPGGLSVAA